MAVPAPSVPPCEAADEDCPIVVGALFDSILELTVALEKLSVKQVRTVHINACVLCATMKWEPVLRCPRVSGSYFVG